MSTKIWCEQVVGNVLMEKALENAICLYPILWVTNTVVSASCDHFGKSDNINRMITLTNEFYLSISDKLKCDHTNPPTTLTSDYMTHNQVHIFFLIKKQKIEHKNRIRIPIQMILM